MELVAEPDERIECPPSACAGCGAGLADALVTGRQRRQVTEAQAPPPPKVTEYEVQAKICGGCGAVSVGQAPAHASGRAQYGPQTHAQAANLLVGHHIPVHRATIVLMQLAGIEVSTGWMASVRGKAAALLESGGFVVRLRDLLRSAPAVHADETPARAAGALAYVHVACTRYLTLLHTGGRSADDIDAGGVLPGYTGVIVRDGYSGYSHLTDALHAWCGAHYLLRDLKDLYNSNPPIRPGPSRWPACCARPTRSPRTPAPPATRRWKSRRWPACSPATGPWHPKDSPATTTGRHPPQPTPSAWPAASATSKT